MKKPPASKPDHLTLVTARLFADDVAEIKRRATEAGFTEWQPLLRKIVRDALRTKKVIR